MGVRTMTYKSSLNLGLSDLIPALFEEGLRRCRAWLQRMEHIEMAGATSEAPGTDGLNINDLPDDMIFYIFNILDNESLLAVANVCTRWQQLCMTPYLWKYRSQETFCVHNKNYVKISKTFATPVAKYLIKVTLSSLNASQAAQIRASLISYCPNLTHLEIYSELDNSIFYDLHKFPNLQFLGLDGSHIVKPCDVNRNSANLLPFHAKNLKYIKLRSTLTSEAVQFIASLISYCPNLTHIHVSDATHDNVFDELHQLLNLKYVNFKDCMYPLNSYCDFPFDKLQYLETLMLPRISISRNSLFSVLECKNLVNIDMEYIFLPPEDFLESLVRTKQSTLRVLRISGVTLTDDTMRHLSNCTQLQELFIRICDSLSDSSLLHLSRLKDLRKLEFHQGKFSPSAMVAFLSNNTFQEMTSLWVPQFPVTRQVTEIIQKNAPNLKEFRSGHNYTYTIDFKVRDAFENSLCIDPWGPSSE